MLNIQLLYIFIIYLFLIYLVYNLHICVLLHAFQKLNESLPLITSKIFMIIISLKF